MKGPRELEIEAATDLLATVLAITGTVLALIVPLVMLDFVFHVGINGMPDPLRAWLSRVTGLGPVVIGGLAGMGVILFLGWGLYLLIQVIKLAQSWNSKPPRRWLLPTVTLYFGVIAAWLLPWVLRELASASANVIELAILSLPAFACALSIALWWRLARVARLGGVLQGRTEQ